MKFILKDVIMFTDIFGAISKIVTNLVADNNTGSDQRFKTAKDISAIITSGKFGSPANIAKEARRNIGQFPIIISNSIGDDQALKICEIVERTIADMILLCIQNGNNLLNLNDPDEKRKFIDKYTNAGNTSLDADVLSYGRKSFASDYKRNCVSGIDAITLKNIANEAMMLEDMPIVSSFEMKTLFNPCLSVADEFEMGAVAPVSVPLGAADANNDYDDEYDDDEYDEIASEAKQNGNPHNVNPQRGPKPGGHGGGSGGSGNGSGSGGSGHGGGSGHHHHGSGGHGGSGATGPHVGGAGTRPTRTPNRARPGNPLVRPDTEATYADVKCSKIEEKVSKLSPTIVNATVLLQTPTNTLERNLAFGVKVNAHEVSSDELVRAIKETYSSTSFVSRLIRWRSGELSFFKDVLLNLKEIKQTVATRNNRNTKNGLSGVFASMRFMNKNALATTALTKDGALLPTVSIMMTLDEVDQIKNTCGKDLFKNIKDARELCTKLGLFGILIVDAANDSFYSFFNDDSIMYKKTSLKDNKNKNSDDVVKAIFGALKR